VGGRDVRSAGEVEKAGEQGGQEDELTAGVHGGGIVQVGDSVRGTD